MKKRIGQVATLIEQDANKIVQKRRVTKVNPAENEKWRKNGSGEVAGGLAEEWENILNSKDQHKKEKITAEKESK